MNYPQMVYPFGIHRGPRCQVHRVLTRLQPQRRMILRGFPARPERCEASAQFGAVHRIHPDLSHVGGIPNSKHHFFMALLWHCLASSNLLYIYICISTMAITKNIGEEELLQERLVLSKHQTKGLSFKPVFF